MLILKASNPEMMALLRIVRRALSEDAVLQSTFFAIQDSDLFLAELIQFCGHVGAPISEHELTDALRQGRRRWLERDLP